MDLSLYLGLSQSALAVIVVLMKRPLRISDVILSILLFTFVLLFGLDVLQVQGILPANRWAISISLSLLFAPLLFLYSKYVTKEFKRFNTWDLMHALPSFLLLLVYFIVSIFTSDKSIWMSMQSQWLRTVFGNIFVVLLVAYVFFSLRIVVKFKKQSKNYYSFKSDKISLNWLIFVIVAFFLVFVAIIISSLLFEYQLFNSDLSRFRHLIELLFVYIISIWGFRQTQLNQDAIKETRISRQIKTEKNSPGKYQKSGLKKEQIEDYLHKLIETIEQAEAWKDNELSIEKLSIQTNIPKYYISEILNEHIGKNFYQFINEYRLKHAKKLLKSTEHSTWSIIAIAFECGFNSKTAFNNFFRKQTNMTPSEFKNLEQ